VSTLRRTRLAVSAGRIYRSAAAVHDSYADLGAGGFEFTTMVKSGGYVVDLRTQLGATITDRIVLNGMKFIRFAVIFERARWNPAGGSESQLRCEPPVLSGRFCFGTEWACPRWQ